MGTNANLYLLGSPRPIRAMSQSDVKFVFGTFTFSTSYTSGGEALTPASMGLEEVFFCITQPAPVAVNAALAQEVLQAVYDITNQKMIAFGQSATTVTGGAYALSECKQASNLSGFTVRYMAAGRI